MIKSISWPCSEESRFNYGRIKNTRKNTCPNGGIMTRKHGFKMWSNRTLTWIPCILEPISCESELLIYSLVSRFIKSVRANQLVVPIFSRTSTFQLGISTVPVVPTLHATGTTWGWSFRSLYHKQKLRAELPPPVRTNLKNLDWYRSKIIYTVWLVIWKWFDSLI